MSLQLAVLAAVLCTASAQANMPNGLVAWCVQTLGSPPAAPGRALLPPSDQRGLRA